MAAASMLDTPTDAAMEPITRLDLDVLARCFPLMAFPSSSRSVAL
jgi:hypothetical protein